MNIRQIFHALACFLLPGLATGWMLAAGALQFSSDLVVSSVIFSAFALAGAVTGRWLFRNDRSLAIGLLCLMALPVFSFRWIFPGTAFAFAVFAVRPIRTVNRQLFQTGALASTAAALAVGGQWLGTMFPVKICLFLLLPAAAALLAADRPGRKITASLAYLAGLALLLLPWQQPTAASYILPRGESASLMKSDKKAVLRIGSRIYQLPRDLDRNLPDMMTAALQPQAANLHVLVLEEAPSNAVLSLRKLPWVDYAENKTLFPNLPGLDELKQDQYDLIFIQELPGSTQEARNMLLRRILQTMLTPGGVLAAPAEYTANTTGFHSAPLPGSGGRIRIWAENSTPLADTFSKLEARMKMRNPGQDENKFTGIMQTLYELRPVEPAPEQRSATPLEKSLYKLRYYLQKTWLLLPASVIFLLGICWFSRSPRYGENFAVFVHGTACMLCLLTVLQEAGKYQLLLPTMPLAAMFGLIAVALPHRSGRARKWMIPAILCAAIAGAAVFADLPSFLPEKYGMPEWLTGAMLLPALFLLSPAVRFGCVHKGAESARYLHFAGLLAGTLLMLSAPRWAALLAALLLFAA